MATEIIAKMEFELSGFMNGWTTVTRDVRGSITGHRGLPGGTPKDRVARTGVMQFSLDNSQNNSAHLLGYYTPGHANCRTGFAKSIGVRFSVVIGADTFIQFTGRLENINPTIGVTQERLSHCTVVDFMNETVKKRLNTLTLQRDIADDEAFSMVLATVPLQPRAIEVGTGFDTLEFVFDTVKDERTSPMAEFQRLAQSTLAFIYVKNTGTIVYEPRSVRARNVSNNLVNLTPADFPPGQSTDIDDDRATVSNRVTAGLHPRTLGTDVDTVLYEITAAFEVQANSNVLIRGLYTETGLRVRRAGGLDMLAAAPTTDYLFNTAADGSGADVTASVTVDTIFTANSVLFTITAAVNCYCIKLQARGTQVIDNANMIVEAEDADSIDEIGEVAFGLDMPYVGDPVFGNEVVQYLLFLAQTNIKRVKKTQLWLNGVSSDRAKNFAYREISDRFTVTEPMSALAAGGFFINGISFSYDEERQFKLEWLPALADSTAYWLLEIPGFSELGFTTRLGFGLILGHTDVEHDDSHGDSAHADVAHSDTHTDVAHVDTAHADGSGHGDSHTDVAHADSSHADTAHSDVAHVDSHSDAAAYNEHTDVAHTDNHGDEDFHFDVPEHLDGPEYSYHGDITSHTDSHGDQAHGDFHNDVGHTDEHGDGDHTDVAHVDANHGDTAHQDVAHVDSATHNDTAHQDTAHTDVAHVDVAHSDTAHSDTHGDREHGDIN